MGADQEGGGGIAGEARCGTCAFIDARNPNDVFCRAHPAAVVVMRERGKDVVRQFYPNVHPVLDWCGEHKMADG